MLIIADWNRVFENSRSRRVETLDWVRMPNRHDGHSYAVLLDHPDGLAHYGCWSLIVQVASKCHPRGTLVMKNGLPHDAKSLALTTRSNEKTMASAITRLLEIGWLISTNPVEDKVTPECQASDTKVTGECHPSEFLENIDGQQRRVEKSREEKRESEGDNGSSPSAPVRVFKPRLSDEQVREIYKAYPRHDKPEAAYKAIAKAFNNADCRTAADWHAARSPKDNAALVFRFLLNRTKLYADYCAKNEDKLKPPGNNFIPYPATWFNAGSYMIDPDTQQHYLMDQESA